MTEFDFLSPEVENEVDIAGEEADSSNVCSAYPENRICDALSTDKSHFVHASCEDESSGKETVEICQKTVNPHNRVSSENFNIQRVIGKGGYGKVFLVQKVDGIDKGKLYAMKVLKKARLICNEKDKAHTVSERNILEMLRHPFLVRLHYAFQNHSNLYIVLEYCPGGELFNYLEREGALLENAACFYTAEIVLAIGHLHSLGIIYRDLKSENVLLDRQGHVKLTDFGLSKEGVCTTNTFCGTIEYMAPEIIKYEGHGKAVDWWSLGTLLFDMLSGGPPFSQEESREATTQKILTAPLKFPPSFSPEVTSLIKGLLKRDPKERLGSKEDVEEIKRHKFFRRYEINWSDVFYRRLKPPFKPRLLSDNDTSMFDPTFTRLQPVVSPSDGSQSIPTDLFQGFSYVAQSVCDDHVRDTWAETTTSSRRRYHGERGTFSTGRLRRLGGAPCHWSMKSDDLVGHNRNGNTTHPGQDIRRNGPDLSIVPVPNGLITRNPRANAAGREDNAVRTILTHSTANLPISSDVGLPPSASQVTLTGRDSDMDLDPDSLSGFAPPVDNFDATDASEGGSIDIGKADDHARTLLQEDNDEADEDDDDDEELEEENVPGAKQIQQTRDCTFYIPPNTIDHPATKDVTGFNFAIKSTKEEQSGAIQAYPISLTHAVSGNQLRTKAMHPTTVISAMPHRSHLDLKSYTSGQHNKSIALHARSSDHLGSLQTGQGNAHRLTSARLLQTSNGVNKASGTPIPGADVLSASDGSGTMGTTTPLHQNAQGKCSMM